MLELNESNFVESTSDGLVLVDFYTPWCGPCRLVAPVLEQLDAEDTGCKIVKVDASTNGELAVEYNVTGVPCLVFLKDGVEVDRFLGLQSKETLQKKIEELKTALA